MTQNDTPDCTPGFHDALKADPVAWRRLTVRPHLQVSPEGDTALECATCTRCHSTIARAEHRIIVGEGRGAVIR
jgi:hypothetical protein